MATTTVDRQSVELVIPAAYLEDARRAAMSEVNDDSEGLARAAVEDRAMAARILSRSSRLLDQLHAGTRDMRLVAENDKMSSPLLHLLEALVHLWVERLRDVAQFRPTPMGDVTELAARLRWAAEEAIRIAPGVDDRLAASDWHQTETEEAGRRD